MVSYFEEYEEYIKSLKKEGYSVINYARKSKGKETEDNRIKLLQLMCNCLRNRSLVDCVFVSYSCNASDPLHSKDKSQEPRAKKKYPRMAILKVKITSSRKDLKL